MKSVKIKTADLIKYIRENADSFSITGDRVNCTLNLDNLDVTLLCINEIHVETTTSNTHSTDK